VVFSFQRITIITPSRGFAQVLADPHLGGYAEMLTALRIGQVTSATGDGTACRTQSSSSTARRQETIQDRRRALPDNAPAQRPT
jgi:hypothetical protein